MYIVNVFFNGILLWYIVNVYCYCILLWYIVNVYYNGVLYCILAPLFIGILTLLTEGIYRLLEFVHCV